MSKRLDDIINDLVYQVGGNIHYLGSASQKHLFAERRLTTLKKQVKGYMSKIKVENSVRFKPPQLSIEMNFDHCITSLRSSLEHLAQLINSVIPLNLVPKVTKGEMHVTLKYVVDKIADDGKYRNDPYLSKLSSFLRDEMDKNWYTELHNLRIEMFHIQSWGLIRSAAQRDSLDHQIVYEMFFLPVDIFSSAKTKRERDICHYCQSKVENVENVLYNIFYLLSKYLS